jgi:hypothetical protein
VSTACSVVIFGVTGDLSERKLIPAVYNLGLIIYYLQYLIYTDLLEENGALTILKRQ